MQYLKVFIAKIYVKDNYENFIYNSVQSISTLLGWGVRTYHLIKHLAKKHKVYLFFPSYKQFKNKNSENHQSELKKMGVKISEIKSFVNLLKHPIVEHLNPFFLLKCLDTIIPEKIDLIICDYPWSGTYVFGLYLLTENPFILVEHNIEYLVKNNFTS
jgi:hypothetical protein